jgi:hypothetical protein
VLEEALAGSDPGAPERTSASRALADILLRMGEVRKAEVLWEEALALAQAASSRDGEARARRGLALVRALAARLVAGAHLLDAAEDLLDGGGDDRVRAGVLARSIELDTVAGRFGSALRRSETLLDLVRDREMSERMAEAWALHAEVQVALGDAVAARVATRHAATYAKANAPVDVRIRIARILANLGAVAEALEVLPAAEEVSFDPVEDLPAQLAALRARLLASTTADTARDLATWAIVRQAPLLSLRSAVVSRDAAMALATVADIERARVSAKRGLKAMSGPGTDGFTLELLLVLYRTNPDQRVLVAGGEVARRIVDLLPPALAETFLRREDVAICLATQPGTRAQKR